MSDLLQLYSTVTSGIGDENQLSFGKSLYGNLPATLGEVANYIEIKKDISQEDSLEKLLVELKQN